LFGLIFHLNFKQLNHI